MLPLKASTPPRIPPTQPQPHHSTAASRMPRSSRPRAWLTRGGAQAARGWAGRFTPSSRPSSSQPPRPRPWHPPRPSTACTSSQTLSAALTHAKAERGRRGDPRSKTRAHHRSRTGFCPPLRLPHRGPFPCPSTCAAGGGAARGSERAPGAVDGGGEGFLAGPPALCCWEGAS